MFMHMLVHFMVAHKSLRLCSLVFKLFYFCSSDSIISTVLLLFFRLPDQICPWIPLVKFSFQYFTFQLQQFCYMFLLLIYSFHTYIIFFTFPAFSFSDLSILKTVLFKSLSGVSAIRFFPASLCWFTFFFWMGHTFMFPCMSCDFCCGWKLDIWIEQCGDSGNPDSPPPPGLLFCCCRYRFCSLPCPPFWLL